MGEAVTVRSPGPDPQTLAAIAGRYGFAPDAVRPLPQGEANHVYLLGESLVLRIPRDQPERIAGLRKESGVIPAVRAAGMRTPALVDVDDGARFGVPFLVLERCAGVDLERQGDAAVGVAAVYRAVGRQLALLHQVRPGDAPALSELPVDRGDRDDPGALLGPLVDAARLDRATAAWLDGWFHRLAQHRPIDPPRVLIHGDVAPRNLLAGGPVSGLTGIVDWGDAAWADPAMDFAKLPLHHVTDVLTGYLPDGEDAVEFRIWQARALHYHLHWAVAAIGRPAPGPGRPPQPGAGLARLLVVLRFLIDTPDQRWRSFA